MNPLLKNFDTAPFSQISVGSSKFYGDYVNNFSNLKRKNCVSLTPL